MDTTSNSDSDTVSDLIITLPSDSDAVELKTSEMDWDSDMSSDTDFGLRHEKIPKSQTQTRTHLFVHLWGYLGRSSLSSDPRFWKKMSTRLKWDVHKSVERQTNHRDSKITQKPPSFRRGPVRVKTRYFQKWFSSRDFSSHKNPRHEISTCFLKIEILFG